MEEKWIKVREIVRVSNLIKEKNLIELEQKEWKEILEQYKIKCKFEITQDTEYVRGRRSAVNMQKVYILNLYTTKEYLQQMKSIIHEYENAPLEIPEELKEQGEEDNSELDDEERIEEEYEDLVPTKISKYFFIILMLLLIVLEVGVVIVSEKNSNNIEVYVLIAILIIVELYAIVKLNKKKRKKKNEFK
ncbi:MAG: hypothetical protein ACI4VH_05865 [Clostridia bacterium]